MDERQEEAQLGRSAPEREPGLAGASPLEPGVTQEVARFELLEERALVEKRRELASRVQVRRVVERHTETVTVELLTETVVIEVVQGASGVFLDGEPLAEGETREIVTYREEAAVTKRPVVSEEVRLLKRGVTNEQHIDVNLGREVLRFSALDPNAPEGVTGQEEGAARSLDSFGGDPIR